MTAALFCISCIRSHQMGDGAVWAGGPDGKVRFRIRILRHAFCYAPWRNILAQRNISACRNHQHRKNCRICWKRTEYIRIPDCCCSTEVKESKSSCSYFQLLSAIGYAEGVVLFRGREFFLTSGKGQRHPL